MSGLGEAASKIGEKIVDILDVFDLSFFISGAVVMAGLLQFLGLLTKTVDEADGAGVFGLVLGSYVLGLVCFAVGRPLRVKIMARRKTLMPDHLLFHAALVRQGLGDAPGDPLRRYFGHSFAANQPTTDMTLYTRMWAHVRSYPELQTSFSLLNRYWVLSASYDGISIAAIVWLLPVWKPVTLGGGSGAAIWAGVWSVMIAGAVVACWHRAIEYKRYQIEEMVATVAHWISLVGRRELEAAASAPHLSTPEAEAEA